MSKTSWGMVTNKMMASMKPVVEGKIVWALGSGPDDKEAKMLYSLGAGDVTLIDKLRPVPSRRVIYFRDFYDRISAGHEVFADVAFIKWPVNTASGADGLSRIAALCSKIIYIGKNDGCTACGDPNLWYLLRRRKLETVVEHEANDMLIYGEYCAPRNPETREEAMTFTGDTGAM